MGNMLTTSQLVELLKNQLKKFALHRFNVQQTTKTYNILANLHQYSILKIYDFSEKYTCLLPEEIQSIHWTQETVTIYPVVVMRKIGENIREDHLVFISDDKKKMFHLLNTVMIFYKITISHKVFPISMILNIMMVALPSLNVFKHLVVWLEERPKRHAYFPKLVMENQNQIALEE